MYTLFVGTVKKYGDGDWIVVFDVATSLSSGRTITFPSVLKLPHDPTSFVSYDGGYPALLWGANSQYTF
jgi:hypothetical protein